MADRKTWEGVHPGTGEKVQGVRAWANFILPEQERDEIGLAAKVEGTTFNDLCTRAMMSGLTPFLEKCRALSAEERAKYDTKPSAPAVGKIDDPEKLKKVIAAGEKTAAAAAARMKAAQERLAALQASAGFTDPSAELGTEDDVETEATDEDDS